ncbi:MAG: hypothetical protein WC603_02040 [Candidatus Paceibacterota bacterium]|jgi:hypothetical protein
MKKELKQVKDKLNKQPLSSLSINEMAIYFEYRLENLRSKAKVITETELYYLFSETGPGNLRIDPRIIKKLTDEKLFIDLRYQNIPGIKQIKDKKIKVNDYLIKNRSSEKTLNLIIKIFKRYLEKVKLISSHPFVIEAEFNDIPITILFKNGEWIFPDSELFLFIQKAQKESKFPIVIAKKIPGILFPVFKGLSMLGLSLYKTYLPEEIKETVDDINEAKEDFYKLKYNDQLQFLNEKANGKNLSNDQIINFFENTLPNNIEIYYNNFTKINVKVSDNLIDTVAQFRKNKVTKAIIASHKKQEELLK